MSRESILLLGGTGFIGRALAERMEREGMTVHILGRPNAETLEKILPQCRTVFHLASATTPGASGNRPDLELGNLTLTLRLLELMQNQPETHLIFFSSGGTVYGNPDRLPVPEDAPIAPVSNYGAGKAAQEVFFQAFRAGGHAVTILRPSNAYGPGQTMHGGFGLIRTMLEHARAGTAMKIWGNGENVRDFIYIGDVVEACMRFIALPQDSGTYNLGSGIGYSINQVQRMVEQVTGIEPKISRYPARGIDVRAVVLDIGCISRKLAWTPAVELREGLIRTWAWLQKAQ